MEEAGFDSHKAFARAVLAESERAGDPLSYCDHTYVTRWLKGGVPQDKTPMYIAATLSRALRRQVTPADIGMPLAGHLPTVDFGLVYPDTPADAAQNVAVLWQADLDEAIVLQRGRLDPAAWNDASLRWLLDPARPLDGEQARSARIGMADIDRFRATADMFAQLDNRFGGGHARQALIQYLSTDGARCCGAATPRRWAAHCSPRSPRRPCWRPGRPTTARPPAGWRNGISSRRSPSPRPAGTGCSAPASWTP
ncbi:MAG TPA: hypothetical protein VKV80_15255 [Streptosporangiaceae bacterium]|nr:hypothetical protein [Streptosporangiaceae bacterium]